MFLVNLTPKELTPCKYLKSVAAPLKFATPLCTDVALKILHKFPGKHLCLSLFY